MIFKYLPYPNAFTGFFVHLSTPAETCFLGSCHMSTTISGLSLIYRTQPTAKNAKSKSTETFCLQETSWHDVVQHPCSHMVNWRRLLCTMSSQAMRDSNSPGNLFQCLTILISKKLLLCVQMESLTRAHLVLSLKTTKKSLAPPSSFPPARCQDLPHVFSSPHQQVPTLSASHTWSCAGVLH